MIKNLINIDTSIENDWLCVGNLALKLNMDENYEDNPILFFKDFVKEEKEKEVKEEVKVLKRIK